MNQKVTVAGMQVNTKVSSNLMIAEGSAGTGAAGEAAFGTRINQTSAAGVLEPVSTVNGVDFFYTTSGKADGDASAEDYLAYDQAAFRTAYGVAEAVGYVDYVFELKAVNTSTTASKYIDLSKLDLVYTGTAEDTQKAFRVAMFVQNGSTFNPEGAVTAYEAMASSAKCIIDITGAANQTADYAVSAASTAPTAISIMATKALTSIEVAQNSTKYFKVTLRMYLEGEDKTCTNSTFLQLVDAWRLECQFTLADSNASSITEITKYAAKSLALNTTPTLLYFDGTDLFKAADMTQLNVGSVIASATLTDEELSALNSAFGSSFTRG